MPNTPKVLWKLFHKKARTLGDTIVSVIPPAADGCRCRLRRPCIRCRGPDVMSFLLRPNDPSDYRSLLTNCFVVLNTAAPRLPDFVPHSNWSQPQIVAHTIEKIKHDHPNVPNVISHGYDKYSQSSTVLELLTTSAWSTLLTRVGETVMVYLLMHTSIFLPHPKKKHLQVTGAPIPALCKFKYFKYKSMVKQGHPSPKSRKRSGACSVQRSTKRRRVDLQEMSSTAHLPSVSTNEESGRCQTHLYADSICQYRKTLKSWMNTNGGVVMHEYETVLAGFQRHMCKLIKKMKSVPLGPNLLPDVQLEDAEVEWLGLNAYSKVLNRKQSRHKELLSLLRLKLLAHIITGSLSSPLTYAIDDSRSSIMWKIKY